jgi:excisionase family DNA binding protein
VAHASSSAPDPQFVKDAVGLTLTAQQPSRWLRIPARTVRLWAASGEIPALKVGRQWRFPEPAIREWIGRGQQGGKILSTRSGNNGNYGKRICRAHDIQRGVRRTKQYPPMIGWQRSPDG